MVFIIGMAVITILSFGVIVYSLAVMASKTDELMAMINDERSITMRLIRMRQCLQEKSRSR